MISVFGKPPKKVTINYTPHEGQQEVSNAIRENFQSENPASIIEIIAGRGWGKTLYLVCEILVPYLELTGASAKVMWVAPYYNTAMAPIDDVFNGIDERTGERYIPQYDDEGNKIWEYANTKSGPTLRWWNGAVVSFKSADAPESIVSRGYSRIILDETALIAQSVFDLQVMGTARRAGIKIFMITTPRGKKHWTYPVFMRGQDKSNPMYLSFQQPSERNPYFNATLKEMIKNLPDWIRRQEYGAEFIDDGDSVIKGLEHVLFGTEQNFPSPQQEWTGEFKDIVIKDYKGVNTLRKASDRRFVAGLDLAKSVDFTVLWVIDCDTGEFIYYRRMNKVDYREVLAFVVEKCKFYNSAELIFDATGVGQGLSDVLNDYDIVTHPFVFTNESKNELINKLILSIEYQEIKIPNIITVKNELNAFTYTVTRTAKISYSAPPGMHDDIVIALALANWGRKESAVADTVGVLDQIIDWNSIGRKKSIFDEIDEDND